MTENNRAILAIDSATSVLKVGLSPSIGIIAEAHNSDRYRHAEFIFTLIENVLAKSKLNKAAIGSIIICTGPGSFTGLRVGMASAKALAVSLSIPLGGVSVFSAVAPRLYREQGRAAVLVPSRRNEYYFAPVDSESFDDRSISVITVDELQHATGLPPLYGIDCDLTALKDVEAPIISNESFQVGLADLINIGRQRLEKTGGDDITRLEPLYIQEFKAGKIK